jgi:hypothetical protein
MNALAQRLPIAANGFPRLMVLFLRQRQFLVGQAAVVAIIVAMNLLTGWFEAEGKAMRMTVCLVAGPALVASVVGIAMWSPSADLEQGSSFPLRWPRSLHLAALAGIGALGTTVTVAGWDQQVLDIDQPLMWARNLVVYTGFALVAGRLIGAQVSWVAPCAMAMVAVIRVLRANPVDFTAAQPAWAFPAHHTSSATAICLAGALFALGAIIATNYGPKVGDPAGE